VQIEDADNNATQLIYVPLEQESGIDPQFTIPGWSIGSPVFSVVNHSYPWGETYSLVSFNVPITKNATDSIIQTLIPPLIFCFIASISFFVKVEHSELVHLRYILTTSMFITAVLYHYSELSGLLGLGVLKLFDKYMIAVYLFLAATIVVTTLCYLVQWDWKRPELVKPINRYGMVISILVPVVTLWLLMVLM
jgi:hypothetical protein